MKQRTPLNPTQIKIIKAKVAGVPQREIGKQVFPNASPGSQSTLVSRELNKVDVQAELVKAFEKHGITLDSAVLPVAEGLKAVKDSGDADHSVRLKAAGMAFGLMGVGKQSGDVTINFINQSGEQRQVYDL